MTAKRFEVVMNEFDEVEYIMDKVMMEDRDFAEFIDFVEDVCKENEELKTKNNAYIQDIEVFKEEITHLKLENEQLRYNYNEKCNEYCGLEEQVDILLKENEKLKSDVYDWKASAEDYLKLGKSLKKENEQLKKDNEWLFKCVEKQSALIHELDSTIMAYNMEHKIVIKLTEKDLKTLDKALSYYTHQKVEE